MLYNNIYKEIDDQIYFYIIWLKKNHSMYYEGRQNTLRYKKARLNHEILKNQKLLQNFVQQDNCLQYIDELKSQIKQMQEQHKQYVQQSKLKNYQICTIKPLPIRFYSTDQKLINIFQKIMIDHFPGKKIYIYGGLLRDRLTESIHGISIKVSDYDFMIREDLFQKLKQILVEFELKDIKTTEIINRNCSYYSKSPKMQILYAKILIDSRKENINIKTYPIQHQICTEFRNRDFYVNNLTYDVIEQNIVQDKNINRVVKDVEERKIDIINTFDETFLDQEVRFLRALILIGKGYTLSENLKKQIQENINTEKFNLNMKPKYMISQMTRIMHCDNLDEIFQIIQELKIERIFFRNQDNIDYLEFLQIHKKIIRYQLKKLKHIKNGYLVVGFGILKKIIELIQKLLIPLTFLFYIYQNKKQWQFSIFQDISYNVFKKMNLLQKHKNNIEKFCQQLIKNMLIHIKQQKDNIYDFYKPKDTQFISLHLLYILLTFDINSEYGENLKIELSQKYTCLKQDIYEKRKIQKQWNFLVDLL